jgi:hypothetical protein
MRRRIKVLAVLFATFIVTFFIMTAVTDFMARQMGFYAQGEEDSRSLSCGD